MNCGGMPVASHETVEECDGAMLFVLITTALWSSLQAALTEFSGFHCMMRHSMRMNRAIHGKPQETSPPFEFRFMDAKGYETRYYEPGKVYTIRLIGFVHFRGLLLQGRLASENGFLLGSLKGGRFIKNENWETFGIRMQDCDPSGSSWQDSVTHIDDSQKFIVQLQWTTEKDIAMKEKPVELPTSTHYKQPLFVTEKGENLTTTGTTTVSTTQNAAVHEKHVMQRFVPETLRDLAYRHENEVEEKVSDRALSIPTLKPGSSTQAGLPLTWQTWQLRTGKPNKLKHVYDGRFPKIFMGSLSNGPSNGSEVKMMSVRMIDKCVENPCGNGGRCHPNSSAELGFTCLCKEGWSGSSCERKCDPNLCRINGTCVEKSDGELGCECPPGASGRYCEREINECNFQRCKNGARCIDKWNDYSCICRPGWMGKDCDRPCQDIYRSCNQWKQQGQCEQMRHHTPFFDVNCALSCGQCSHSNAIVRTTRPLAPILLPLAWMIGIWKAEVNGTRSRTVDYVTDFEGISYTEILAVTVADVLVFGKPSINFTSIAINRDDTSDQHIHYGFLTVGLNPGGKPLVALITTSNLGQIMIEEGEIRANSVQFTPTYRSVFLHTASSLPLELHRTFWRNDKRLVQSFTKRDVDGRNRSVTKRYDKIVNIEYL
ncbi:unnamed protein product [Litomosoides sigmodontis]|uniref:EGF-like domain-containing protein n=1 Tax=Litomosoides sigmodontis TaxID=42156 RepID=A0A3P6TTT6_LITSI|nr:unnamed protein product [Litomosoides sigmodontis]